MQKKSNDHRIILKIRPAEPSDTHFVIQLSGRAFHMYGPYESMIASWLESGVAFCLIGDIREKSAAFAMVSNLPLEVNPARISELLAIAVVPERQGMGIGKNLLKEMEKRAAEMNIKELLLHTATDNMAAQRLFIKNGYQAWRTKRNFYPAGQDAIFMSKRIKARRVKPADS
jgi:ribosomal-protein-alanine N-acetyltransferase